MHVKPHHPLQELLAKELFAIETVPVKEQTRMVNSTIRAAVKWHKEQVDMLEDLAFDSFNQSATIETKEIDGKMYNIYMLLYSSDKEAGQYFLERGWIKKLSDKPERFIYVYEDERQQ